MAHGTNKDWTLIDDLAKVETALAEINRHTVVAVDSEGVKLGRHGELTVLTIATPTMVYIFDTLVTGKAVFDGGLRELLENSTRDKLFYDCRRDSDSLWHQYNVKLSGVLDLQLLEIMQRRVGYSSSSRRRSDRFDELIQVNGYLKSIEIYSNDLTSMRAKKRGISMLKSDPMIWKERPISDELLRYCKADTVCFFSLYDRLRGNGGNLERLRVASDRYTDLFRSKAIRRDGMYENNPYLPLDVIPEKDSMTFQPGTTQCSGCLRLFPRDEFSEDALRRNELKCRVCKKVMQRFGAR